MFTKLKQIFIRLLPYHSHDFEYRLIRDEIKIDFSKDKKEIGIISAMYDCTCRTCGAKDKRFNLETFDSEETINKYQHLKQISSHDFTHTVQSYDEAYNNIVNFQGK